MYLSLDGLGVRRAELVPLRRVAHTSGGGGFAVARIGYSEGGRTAAQHGALYLVLVVATVRPSRRGAAVSCHCFVATGAATSSVATTIPLLHVLEVVDGG